MGHRVSRGQSADDPELERHRRRFGKTRRQNGQLVVECIDIEGDGFAWFGDPIPTFDWTLRAHALGQVLPLPLHDDGARLLEASPLEVFSAFGKVAACATTRWDPPPPPKALRSTSDLVVAVRLEQADRITRLADAGASLNSRAAVGGFTALHLAAVKGNVTLARHLLDLGANPNVLADRDASVLGTALVHGAPVELVRLLVARGADASTVNSDGFGVLHALAEVNRHDLVAWLVSLGVDLEGRTKHGHTPLHIAAAQGHVEALEALLDAGAEIGALSSSGQTARDIARAEGKRNTFDVLVRRGS